MHIWWTNLINYFDKSGFTSNMYCVVTFEHEVLISQNLHIEMFQLNCVWRLCIK